MLKKFRMKKIHKSYRKVEQNGEKILYLISSMKTNPDRRTRAKLYRELKRTINQYHHSVINTDYKLLRECKRYVKKGVRHEH